VSSNPITFERSERHKRYDDPISATRPTKKNKVLKYDGVQIPAIVKMTLMAPLMIVSVLFENAEIYANTLASLLLNIVLVLYPIGRATRRFM
jgi:hypothetical protein